MQITSVRHTKWENHLVVKTTTDRKWYANIIRLLPGNDIQTYIITGDIGDESRLYEAMRKRGAPHPVHWMEGNGQ